MAYAAEKVLKTSLLSWPLPYHFSVRTTSRQTEIYDSILMTTEKELGDLNFSKRRWRLIATRRLRRRSIFVVKRNCWHYLWRWLYYAIDSTSISTLLIKSFKKENSSRTATFFNRVFFTWRQGGHVGVPNQSCGSWAPFLWKRFLLCQ